MVLECAIVKLNELVLIIGTVFNVIWEARLPGTSSAVPTSFSRCVVLENGIHGSVQKHILKTLKLLNWLSFPVPMMRIKRNFCFIFLSLHYFRKPQELRLRLLHCVSHSRFLCTQVHLPNRYLDKHWLNWWLEKHILLRLQERDGGPWVS